MRGPCAIYQLLGQDIIRYLPGFLNEGLAHYLEYVFKAGPELFLLTRFIILTC